MHEIDRLRAKAKELIEQSRATPNEVHREVLRKQLNIVETHIVEKILARHALPNCPFCRLGKMVTTPTQGRTACDRCRAIGLEGWWHGK